MATTSIVDQIMELEAKKQALMAQAKDEALAAAQKAVADLNSLGFHYKLTEYPHGISPIARAAGPNPRKGGISDEVLAAIKATTDGLSRSGVLAAMNAMDTKAQQSISNAPLPPLHLPQHTSPSPITAWWTTSNTR